IAPHRVLAVGDNENDIPMLKLAGMGVAMGQATEKVKTVARWIAPSVFEDGAAVAMERFVIGRI
ncbi:MAG TPA: HAD hydrolase family protein, partial [Caldilineaceae bacterium]|nr:HAD hydrolase family protein [Caldilineaceae bacterium]